MSKNTSKILKRPDRVIQKANLNNSEAQRMLKLLLDDGYIYRHILQGFYAINQKGINFIVIGGYIKQTKIKL